MKVGIFGRTEANSRETIKKAEEIGRILASQNHVVITGGTGGYPHIVATAALQDGGKSISYATGLSLSDHSKFHNTDLSKYTKIIFQKRYFNKVLSGTDNYLRSLYMCSNVDLGLIIGGRVGTMYEVTILSGMFKDIYVLDGSGGITGETIKEFAREGHKGKSDIIFFKSPEIIKKRFLNK